MIWSQSLYDRKYDSSNYKQYFVNQYYGSYVTI